MTWRRRLIDNKERGREREIEVRKENIHDEVLKEIIDEEITE